MYESWYGCVGWWFTGRFVLESTISPRRAGWIPIPPYFREFTMRTLARKSTKPATPHMWGIRRSANDRMILRMLASERIHIEQTPNWWDDPNIPTYGDCVRKLFGVYTPPANSPLDSNIDIPQIEGDNNLSAILADLGEDFVVLSPIRGERKGKTTRNKGSISSVGLDPQYWGGVYPRIKGDWAGFLDVSLDTVSTLFEGGMMVESIIASIPSIVRGSLTRQYRGRGSGGSIGHQRTTRSGDVKSTGIKGGSGGRIPWFDDSADIGGEIALVLTTLGEADIREVFGAFFKGGDVEFGDCTVGWLVWRIGYWAARNWRERARREMGRNIGRNRNPEYAPQKWGGRVDLPEGGDYADRRFPRYRVDMSDHNSTIHYAEWVPNTADIVRIGEILARDWSPLHRGVWECLQIRMTLRDISNKYRVSESRISQIRGDLARLVREVA